MYGGLQLRTIDEFSSRFKAIWKIWAQWDRKQSPANFFSDKSSARAIELKFEIELPEPIVDTQAVQQIGKKKNQSASQISRIFIETMPNVVQVY